MGIKAGLRSRIRLGGGTKVMIPTSRGGSCARSSGASIIRLMWAAQTVLCRSRTLDKTEHFSTRYSQAERQL
jgi:hypothetical protein